MSLLSKITYTSKEKCASSCSVSVQARPKWSVCDKNEIIAVLTTNGEYSQDNDTYVRNVRAKVKQ